ncbi:unnamed protein product [Prunus armeniaca]|uniref:Uncharacterized protein n=1 Tax=Prunus armeniaca TaxID=36596 RepID=A0A6J5VJ96_PRUAR|nr:unnamed protein product [Prunus armeniaca]
MQFDDDDDDPLQSSTEVEGMRTEAFFDSFGKHWCTPVKIPHLGSSARALDFCSSGPFFGFDDDDDDPLQSSTEVEGMRTDAFFDSFGKHWCALFVGSLS